MDLHYQSLGNGRPIIILHGLFGSSDNWLSIARVLAEHHKVYLLDQRNHGDSFHSDDFNFKVMADDLKNFIEQHTIDDPVIIGHSMGGKVAMHFAVNYPALYDRMIVVDISPKAYPVHHKKILEGLTSINLESLKSRKEADDQLSEYVKDKAERQFLLKNLARKENGNYEWKLNLPVINEQIENMGKGLEGRLASDKSTLFLRGEKSDYIRNEDSISIEAFFPNFEVKTIEGAGHWVHAEQPQHFLKAVNDFINE